MLIYDIEIINAIKNKKTHQREGIKYCSGWTDYAGMGISCICAYDYTEDRYRVFTKDNFIDFIDLAIIKDTLIGFNNINFDNKVIGACLNFNIKQANCFDILRKIWMSAGHDENKFSPATHGNYGLDAMCKANFNIQKLGNGALSPILWQQGKTGSVIDYCLNDVRMTKKLCDKIMSHGFLDDPKTGGILKIKGPE